MEDKNDKNFLVNIISGVGLSAFLFQMAAVAALQHEHHSNVTEHDEVASHLKAKPAVAIKAPPATLETLVTQIRTEAALAHKEVPAAIKKSPAATALAELRQNYILEDMKGAAEETADNLRYIALTKRIEAKVEAAQPGSIEMAKAELTQPITPPATKTAEPKISKQQNNRNKKTGKTDQKKHEGKNVDVAHIAALKNPLPAELAPIVQEIKKLPPNYASALSLLIAQYFTEVPMALNYKEYKDAEPYIEAAARLFHTDPVRLITFAYTETMFGRDSEIAQGKKSNMYTYYPKSFAEDMEKYGEEIAQAILAGGSLTIHGTNYTNVATQLLKNVKEIKALKLVRHKSSVQANNLAHAKAGIVKLFTDKLVLSALTHLNNKEDASEIGAAFPTVKFGSFLAHFRHLKGYSGTMDLMDDYSSCPSAPIKQRHFTDPRIRSRYHIKGTETIAQTVDVIYLDRRILEAFIRGCRGQNKPALAVSQIAANLDGKTAVPNMMEKGPDVLQALVSQDVLDPKSSKIASGKRNFLKIALLQADHN